MHLNFQLILILTFLYQELGIAIFAGISPLFVIVPMNIIGGRLIKNFEAAKLDAKGEIIVDGCEI